MASGPGPPNHPNSFCAPCAANAPPTTARSAVSPSLIPVVLPDDPRALTREQPLEPECERLAGEVVRDVQRQSRSRVVDPLRGRAQRREAATLGVARQLRRAIGVMRQLGCPGSDAGEVAVPEPGELQPVVERRGLCTALGAAGLLPDLDLALAVLLARDVLQLVGEPLLVLGPRGGGARGRELEQRQPGALGA